MILISGNNKTMDAIMTIPTNNRTLGIVFLFLAVFLFGYAGQAQTLGSLYAQEGSDQLYLEEGESLKSALVKLEKHYNVGLLYRSNIVEGVMIRKSSNLSLNVDEALSFLLKETDLKFKALNPKTYGIYKNPVFIQQAVEIPVQQNISGTVVDSETGEALPGVNVIAGSNEASGTTTDMDGRYEIDVTEDELMLVFSYIGYERQEITINGRSEINIELKQDVQLLEDVVVIGYGTQRTREVTSAVTSVDSEDFVTGNINDSQYLLQGKVPGLIVTGQEGGSNIRLRGLSTIGANKEPLFVIDGVIGADLRSIDPNDIESMDVLKDASAAAIYGTRGASGVIIITTKSGSEYSDSGISVTYNGQVTTQVVANRTEMLTAEEYRDIPNQNSNLSIADHGSSTNWFDEVTQRAFTHTHSLAISGGNENTTYRVSGNFRDIQDIQKGVGVDQLNARLSIQHRTLNDRLKLSGSLATTDHVSQDGIPEVFRYATVSNPTAPVFDEDGNYVEIPGFDIYNPVAINELTTIDSEFNNLNLSLRGDYEFRDLIDGLSSSVFYSRETSGSFRGEYRSKDLRWGNAAGRNGLAFRESREGRNQLFENTFNYLQNFGIVGLESVAGYSYQEFTDQGMGVSAGDLITDEVLYHNLGTAGEFNTGQGDVWSYRTESKLIAVFARSNFIIDDTWFLSGTIRREGSSRFGEGNKYANFFAASAGAELTNLINIPKANQFKLRISYGETGNNAPNSGISKLRFGTGSSFLVNGEFIPSIGPVSNPNPNLKWEIKKEWNTGLDFEFFNSRLSGSLDYYQNVTQDLLLEFNVQVPPNLYPLKWVNIGEISNQGFEAIINYAVLQKADYSWTSGVTFSTQKTILESLSSGDFQFGDQQLIANAGSPGLNGTTLIRVKEGRPIGEIWGKKYAGISENGEWLFYSKEGEIVTFAETTTEDDRVIGNGMPHFQIGIDNTIRFKNWDLNMFWHGVLGHDLVNMYNLFYKNPTILTAYNATKSTQDILELSESPQFSDFYVEDASYLRLQNLTIGYNFDLLSSSMIRDLRLYATANNLWTITKYTGVSPEVRFEDFGNPLAPGIERRNQWFTQTSFVFGIKLGF